MELDIQTRGYESIIIILHLHFTNITELICSQHSAVTVKWCNSVRKQTLSLVINPKDVCKIQGIKPLMSPYSHHLYQQSPPIGYARVEKGDSKMQIFSNLIFTEVSLCSW